MTLDLALFPENMKKEKKCILVCVQSMWGSLEWILPAILNLRGKPGKITVHILINRMYKREFFGSNKILWSLARGNSESTCYDFVDLMSGYLGKYSVGGGYSNVKIIFRWQRYLWKVLQKKLYENYLNAIQPDLVLMDGGSALPLYAAVRKMDVAQVGNFLTAPSLSLAPHIWSDRDILRKRVLMTKSGFDFYLVDNRYAEDFYKDLFPGKKVINIGCPKFDSKWLAFSEQFDDKSAEKSLNREKIIVVLLKNQSSEIFKHFDFFSLLNDIFAVCSKTSCTNLVLKPHPRQDIAKLEAIMKHFPDLYSIISTDPVMALASDAKLFISMPSGIIFDAVLTGKPVIEYFDYGSLNAKLQRSFNKVPLNIMGGIGCMEDGKITSVFRHENLVLEADDMEQLEQSIMRIGQERENTALANLRKIYPDKATGKAAEAILAQIKTH